MAISDEELFRRALESLNPGDIYDGKYADDELLYDPNDPLAPPHSVKKEKRDSSSHPSPPKKKKGGLDPALLEELDASDKLAVSTEDFEHMMRYQLDKITRHDNSKYYEPKPARRVTDIEAQPLVRQIETEPLPTDENGLRNVQLMRYQGELLNRYASTSIERCSEIYLRNLKVTQALQELKDEIEYAHRKSMKFVRVITGKGVHSENFPIIKKEVIVWLEQVGYTMIRGYAPEISADGDYGSIVVEIRARV